MYFKQNMTYSGSVVSQETVWAPWTRKREKERSLVFSKTITSHYHPEQVGDILTKIWWRIDQNLILLCFVFVFDLLTDVWYAFLGEHGAGIDQGVLVQMVTVFIVSCPRETTGAANLQEPVLDCFREAWDSNSVEVTLQSPLFSCSATQKHLILAFTSFWLLIPYTTKEMCSRNCTNLWSCDLTGMENIPK